MAAARAILIALAVAWLAPPAVPAQDSRQSEPALPEVVAGYAAKIAGSGVFVSGRDLQSIRDRELYPETTPERLLSGRLELVVDDHGVTASFFGARRRVICREGLGCTLLIERSADELRRQAGSVPAPQPAEPQATPWPTGDLPPDPAPPPTHDAAALQRVIDASFTEDDPEHPARTYGIVVVHRGQVVAERYGPGFDCDTRLFGASMTKSVLDALVGIRVGQGGLDPDDPSGFAGWRTGDPRAAITLEHLLRMDSGLSCDEGRDLNGNLARMLFARPDAAAFAGSVKEQRYPPGTRWQYCNGTSNIIARVLRDSFDETAEYHAFPRAELFNRIGMRSAVLEVDPSGTFVGSSFMYATARDWARFGLLYLNDGVWDGQRILPEGWVAASLTPTTAAPDGRYGRHWWLNAGPPDRPDDRWFGSLPPDLFMAMGMFGQVLAVVPSRELVIVRLGMSKSRGSWSRRRFLEQVVAAFD